MIFLSSTAPSTSSSAWSATWLLLVSLIIPAEDEKVIRFSEWNPYKIEGKATAQ
jgi:hypothetical protein